MSGYLAFESDTAPFHPSNAPGQNTSLTSLLILLGKGSERVMRTFYRSLQLPFAALLSLGLLCLMAGTVSAHTAIPAHAKVNKAIPAIGSTISQAPITPTVFTLEKMNTDPNKSNLFIYPPASHLITQRNTRVYLTNPR